MYLSKREMGVIFLTVFLLKHWMPEMHGVVDLKVYVDIYFIVLKWRGYWHVKVLLFKVWYSVCFVGGSQQLCSNVLPTYAEELSNINSQMVS